MNENPPVLTYKISWEDWEKGRAARRAASMRAVKNAVMRRESGDPKKDAILRKLNKGERGMPLEAFKKERSA